MKKTPTIWLINITMSIMLNINMQLKLSKVFWEESHIAGIQSNGSLTISRQNDIVCLPNDFATNFMKYFNVEKEQF